MDFGHAPFAEHRAARLRILALALVGAHLAAKRVVHEYGVAKNEGQEDCDPCQHEAL